jgi:hypothetical protein
LERGVDDSEFDPLEHGTSQETKKLDPEKANLVRLLHAKQDAFRDIADRFYMLWWNLPKSRLSDVDSQVRDLFRMYMDLAPTMGVSRNGIPELRECCGRKRDPFRDGSGLDPNKTISGTQQITARDLLGLPPVDEKLGWCPGDLIRRFTRWLGFQYCERCDLRRRRINAFFRCGE